MKCTSCTTPLRRASGIGIFDYLRSMIGIFPWLCPHCKRNYRQVRLDRFAPVVAILALGLAVPVAYRAWIEGRHQAPPLRMATADPGISIRMPVKNIPVSGTTPQPKGPVDVSNILHNEDIGQLSGEKIGGDVLISLIRNSAHSFRIDPAALIALKKRGTPDNVIREVIEVTSQQRGVASPLESVAMKEPLQASYLPFSKAPSSGVDTSR